MATSSVRLAAVLIGICLASPPLPVSASSSRQILQSYDDSVGAGSWTIDNGIEAECGGTGYPTSNWGGQTYDTIKACSVKGLLAKSLKSS